MKLETSLSTRLRQELHLAPQIIQSIEILQMPALDLVLHIQKALAENEAIELEEPEASPSDSRDLTAEDATKASKERERLLAEVDRLQEMADDGPPRRISRGGEEGERKQEALQNAPDRPVSLEAYLGEQFALLDLVPEVRAAGEAILDRLDPDGYFREPLEPLVDAANGAFSVEAAEKALAQIQRLDPRGVGARDLRECLLLQLDPTSPGAALPRLLVEKHLRDVSKNRLPKVARETGRSIEEIQDALQRIRSLDPRPGSRFRSERSPALRPDVAVDLVEGEPEVRVEQRYLPRLRLNPQIRQLLTRNDLDAKTREYLKKKVESARWLMDAVAQRTSTLDRVAREIVAHQRAFFEYGPAALRPLKMQDIADRLGIHVSTVSRAISDKAIATPRGIFPLKAFFTGSMGTTGGEGASRASVRQQVREVVRKEDPRNPLSDDEIAAQLRDKGVKIARRTVTKYRKMLAIPSASQRRQF